MRRDLFLPTVEGEARLLLLINAFTGSRKSLEGRTKLAKLDFFLRYPPYLKRAIQIRSPGAETGLGLEEQQNIEERMVRYRYGPWDPAYFALLGRLIGKGLVEPVAGATGISYRTNDVGRELARQLGDTEEWKETSDRAKLIRKYLDLSGNNLKNFVYSHFPDVTKASWGELI